MSPDAARAALCAGASLVLTHTDEGDMWSIEGRLVPAHQAQALIRDMPLRAADDALFTGALPQTWRADPEARETG